MIKSNVEDNDFLEIQYCSKFWFFKKIQVQLFSESFVENNKDKCKIIYENKEFDLTSISDFDSNFLGKFVIKLKGVNNITNLSCMFKECDSLLSVSDISKLDLSNVNDISNMFYGCFSLISLPGISN